MRRYSRTLLNLLVLVALLLSPAAGSPAKAATAASPHGPGRHHIVSTEGATPAAARQAAVVRAEAVQTTPRAALPTTAATGSPEIAGLARALGGDPRAIFDYVHNTIEFVPIFGTLNGAAGALLAGRGSDADQAALFIALMRAAGYTANYVVGDVTYPVDVLANWVGATAGQAGNVLINGGIPITSVNGHTQITRVWAEAQIGSATYTFDPAMKTYAETAGIADLGAVLGYDRAAFLNHALAGATVTANGIADVNEANVRADLTAYATALVAHIDAALPDGGVADVIGGRAIVPEELGAYATALPHALATANVSRPADLAAYRHTLRIEHAGIDATLATFQLADRRVTLLYDESDGYRPVLRVGGETVATGEPTTLGARAVMTVTVDHPYDHRDQTAWFGLQSGGAYALLHDLNTVSADVIAASNARLQGYRAGGLGAETEAVQGEALALMGWRWLHQVHLYGQLAGRVGDVVSLSHHEIGVMGQEEGIFIDVPMGMVSNVSTDGASDTWAVFRAQTMMGSAFEHGVIEQLQGTEAASTVRMLTLNNANGDRTFLADSSNWATVAPLLQGYGAGQLAQIEAGINAGDTIVLPEHGDIPLNQWRGTGYIDDWQSADGSAGSMGMIISGGYYGGYDTITGTVGVGRVLSETTPVRPDQRDDVETPEDTDPVDMATGAFHARHVDLAVGLDDLLGLRFVRTYNSGDTADPGPLGHGWRHSYDIRLRTTSDGASGLGARGAKDAAALIAQAFVALDMLSGERALSEWMASTLATKWGMDQLTDNAVTAWTGGTSLTFIALPDGAYAPPPGTDRAMRQVGDTVVLQGAGHDALFFDRQGRAQVWQDANGNALTFTYNGDGALQRVATANGMTLTLAYGGGRLTAVTDQTGRTVRYTYTGEALTAYTDALGQSWTYAYDGAHRLTSVTRPKGNTVVTNAYDAHGHVITQTDALGHVTALDFGRLRSALTLPNGERIAYALDQSGRMTAREDPDGHRFAFSYDAQGRFAGLTDRLGGEVRLTRRADGLQRTLTNAAGETMTTTTVAQPYTLTHPLIPGEQITFTRLMPTTLHHPSGEEERYAYDAAGNLIGYTDRAGQAWAFSHSPNGQLVRTLNPAGGIITNTYHASGALASTTDSDIGVTRYAYDAGLRLRQVTYADGGVAEIAYDPNGRITALTDARDQTYTYAYDANGNVITTTDPLGHDESYTYDLMDRRTTRRDRGGNVTAYAYDDRGRLAAVTDPNADTLRLAYGGEGWLTQITDPLGAVWKNGYDAEGALTDRTTPLGHTEQRTQTALGDLAVRSDPLGNTVRLTRDAQRRLATFTDPLGRQTAYTYDDQGRLVGVTQPVIGSTAYAYTKLGRLARVTDLNGASWTLDYSAMGRLATVTDPLNQVWAYTVNTRGFVGQIAYPDGTTETRTYDANGNLTRRQYSDGLDLYTTYDAVGRLTGSNGITLTYNALGQIVNTRGGGADLGATYDPAGRLATVTYPDGDLTVTYGWNARGNLTRVSDDLTGTALDFGYDADNNLTHITRTNGVHTTLTWDGAARLTRLQEGTLADMHYTLNGAGEVTQATHSLPLQITAPLIPDDHAVALTYDAASQVATPGYTYDEQGRVTQMPDGGDSLALTWDAASRLTGIGDVALGYNGLGNPTTRTAAGQTTGYTYNYAISARALVAERDESADRWRRFYVLTPQGELLYAIDAATEAVSFYHYDRQGNTLFLTDDSGELTDAYAYTPYGTQLHHQGDSTQPFTFGGAYQARRERATLYQMGARFYDAQTARFISREILWPVTPQPKAINPYQYAFDNPLKYYDPSGLNSLAQELRVKTGQASPKEYMEWRMAQAPEVIDQQAADAIMDDYRSYSAAWSRQNEGDGSNPGPTPNEYAQALMAHAPAIMGQDEMDTVTQELNRYTMDWVRRTQGDPDAQAANYELSPEAYAKWQMLQAPSIMGSDEVARVSQEISRYTAEWARRHVGDPANYEMTPEEYAKWRMLQAPSIMDGNDVQSLTEDVEAYAQEWARRHLGEGGAEDKAAQMHRLH